MAASTSPDYENTSLSNNSTDCDQWESEQNAFLTQYDPFHGFTYTVHTPGVASEAGEGPAGVDLRAIAQAAAHTSTNIDYQDFAPRLLGFDDGNIRCLETLE